MFDYRSYDPVPCARALQVLQLLGDVIDGIVVDKARALDEVRADYSTTTEIADALLQRADVPFRIGHHFASALTDYGRTNRLRLDEIPFAEAQRIYREHTGQALPLTVAAFSEVISAEYMVFGRKGLGGPQRSEVARLLGEQRTQAAADAEWLQCQTQHQRDAEQRLQAAFAALAAE
jgi:argininosuccinate lyase